MSDQQTTAAGGERRTRAILLSVLGGIVALALVWLWVLSPLLTEDQDDDSVAQATAVTTQADEQTVAPQVEATEDDEDVTLPVETYEIFLARDPFEPIRPGALNGPDGADGDGNGRDGDAADMDGPDGDADGDGMPDGQDGDDGVDTDGDGQDGDDLPPTNGADDDGDGELPPTDGDGDGGDERQDREEVDRREVVLIDVFEENGTERAVVQVDSTSYTVGEGDTFAVSFRALSIDPPCATFLYGDNRFQLCEGDRVLK